MKLLKIAFHSCVGYTSYTIVCQTARSEESIQIKGAYISFSCSIFKVPSIIKSFETRISLWQQDHSAQFEVRLKDVLNLWGPVRGIFPPNGAQRALDLAEVRLPLGRNLQGLLVLLIAGHDRSTPVQPELLSFLFLSPSSFSPSCTGLLSLAFSLPYLPPHWPISSPLFYPLFLSFSLAIYSFSTLSLTLSALLSDWGWVTRGLQLEGATVPRNYISFYYPR